MKEKNQTKKIGNAIRTLDSFGESASFTTFNGRTKVGSIYGAILTLLIFSVTLLYGVSKFIVLKDREDTNFTEREIKSPDIERELTANEIGFDMMF